MALLAGTAVPVFVLLKLRGLWYPPSLPWGLLLGGVAAGCLLAWCWPLPDALVAASTDRRLRLRDRLLTALHCGETGQTGMQQAVVADTLEHLTRPAGGGLSLARDARDEARGSLGGALGGRAARANPGLAASSATT